MNDQRLGPLGKRLLAAFLVVSFLSIGTLTAAAFVSAIKSASNQELRNREAVTSELLLVINNPGEAKSLAERNGLRYILRGSDGHVITAYGFPTGAWTSTNSNPNPSSDRWYSREIPEGSISVWFPTMIESHGSSLEWSWIALAAAASASASLILAWFASRRIAMPLIRTANAAQRFAGGDRTSRTNPRDANARWEIGDLARAFDATADDVVSSEHAQRRLSADVAHELRTPLTVLLAGLEELRDGLVPADTENLSRLHSQSLRLSRLVDDLLSLADARNRGMDLDLRTVELGQIVRNATQGMTSLLLEAGIETRLTQLVECQVVADSDRIHQVLVNLLSNVLRYCRSGDRVELEVNIDGDEAVLTVSDTGPGVPEGELPYLFDRLWRGTATSDSQGSGIGLAVVKELVDSHGGRVLAHLNQTGGLAFEVRLPRV